jgi:outer membrane protein assembly factor BamB
MSAAATRKAAGALLLLLAAGAFHAAGADWPQWRGPNRDGTVAGCRPSARWLQHLARKWKVEVGAGHSSPLIAGDAAFVFAREGDNEIVRRLELATGRELWRDSCPAPFEMSSYAQSHGKGPKSTPVCADGRLYTFGISGVLSCHDAQSGKLLWRHEFARQFAKTWPLYGVAMSPLVDHDLLIAHVGGHDSGALTAFDAKTGEVRWRWAGDGPAYASPIIATPGGARQIITQTQGYCVGVSPDKGGLLWKIPFRTDYDQNSVTPVVAGDTIIFGGTRVPTCAWRARKDGDQWVPEKVWETGEATLFMSTPVVCGQWLYGMSERKGGQMFSLDVTTGRVAWTGDGRFAQNAAIFDAGAALVALTTNSELVIFEKKAATLSILARCKVADTPTWASPAFAGNRILIKDATSLALWEAAAP